LKLGYRVRGTVRSLNNEKKVAFLRNLCPGSRYDIELVEADLTSDKGWKKAVEGCSYILHVASPFPIEEPNDPNDLIMPAVEGTLRVLRAASELTTPPKRVVITSSSAAISYGSETVGKVYNDEDWTCIDSKDFPINSYTKSKTLAERAAWEFVSNLPERKRFELSTINPSFIQGPMLSTADCSSVKLIRQILLAELPGLPDLHFELVSVLDVARAHLLAMLIPEAANKRFLVSSTKIDMREMAVLLREEFTSLGYSPTTFHVPNILARFLSIFDSQVRSVVRNLGISRELDCVNAKKILGMNLKENKRLVIEMAYSAIAMGQIPDKSKTKDIASKYQRPELDVSGIPMPLK
jgi:dihydroflavonol-4-reductase